MKMAKASKTDMAMAVELTHALEAISGNWGATMPREIAVSGNDDGEDAEGFSLDNDEQCRRVCEYLIRLTRSASLMRVVLGMQVCLDPENRLLDPDSDVIAYHQDIATALEKAGSVT